MSKIRSYTKFYYNRLTCNTNTAQNTDGRQSEIIKNKQQFGLRYIKYPSVGMYKKY